MIDGAPEVMRLAIDPYEHLIQVPAPVRVGSMMNAPLSDLRGEHWTEPVPPETHRLMANIDATLEEQIFDLPQRKPIPDVHHHREANYLG